MNAMNNEDNEALIESSTDSVILKPRGNNKDEAKIKFNSCFKKTKKFL
jgi:hypothetical protein